MGMHLLCFLVPCMGPCWSQYISHFSRIFFLVQQNFCQLARSDKCFRPWNCLSLFKFLLFVFFCLFWFVLVFFVSPLKFNINLPNHHICIKFPIHHFFIYGEFRWCTLPETNILSSTWNDGIPKEKDGLPTINLQVGSVSFREGNTICLVINRI